MITRTHFISQCKIINLLYVKKIKNIHFLKFFSFFSLHPLPLKVRSFLVKHWNKFLQQTCAHPINPNYSWKIESNYEGLLNKNCCNGVSCTQLLMIQTMGSKKKIFFSYHLSYTWVDLICLTYLAFPKSLWWTAWIFWAWYWS